MATPELRVRFTKGTDEIDLRVSWNAGLQPLDHPYIYITPDNERYLRVGGRRYYFRRDDVTAPFPNEYMRTAYMKRINDACGEQIAVPC